MRETENRPKLTEADSERLIARYAPLVKAVAQSLIKRLPPSVEFDDLVQDGYVGLLGAVLQETNRMAEEHLSNYLAKRVRGSMMDGLREVDPATRAVRRKMRRVERAIQQLGHQLGRYPSERELALWLDMPLLEYQRLLQDAYGYTVFSIDDFDDQGSTAEFLEWCLSTQSDPLAALERSALQRTLLIAISGLTLREGEVMSLRYVDGLTLRSIGERLSLTEARISQIHAQAIAKLRAEILWKENGASLLAPRRRPADRQPEMAN